MDFLKGGAIFGIIVGLWDKIKEFIWKFISLVVQKVELSTEELHDAVISYLITNADRSKIYDKIYGANFESFTNGNTGAVPYEVFGKHSTMFFHKKGSKRFIKLFLSFNRHTDTPAGNQEQYHGNIEADKVYSTLLCIRGTVDFDMLIAEAVMRRNEKLWQVAQQDKEEEESSRFNIYYFPDNDSEHEHFHRHSHSNIPWYQQDHYRLLNFSRDEIGRAKLGKGSALTNLVFPDEIKKLISSMQLWVKSRKWYEEKGIPWKRGWLLYGVPGVGKTALARAFAEDLNMPIYVFSLSQLNNKTLTNAWKRMQSNIPCIALFEDIDNVFHGRKNISQRFPSPFMKMEDDKQDERGEDNDTTFVPLTFDCFLNCLDGVDKSDGIFTIITTNDITKIDEAIGKPVETEDGKLNFVSTRPGRIDKAIKLGYMRPEDKEVLARRILKDSNDQLQSILKDIDKRGDETPAQFQDVCVQLAVDEYWSKNLE